MQNHFKRERSEFWVNVYYNDDYSYTISTNKKYVGIINHSFPIFCINSPSGWKTSESYPDVRYIWLPEGSYAEETIAQFLEWCKEAVDERLWLGLNKNIIEFYRNELDYCVASDFNYNFGDGRTELGVAEYQLKYNSNQLSSREYDEYFSVLVKSIIDSSHFVPISNGIEWVVSPMPATLKGQTKFAWRLANVISECLKLPFLNPVLESDKPQMKQLSIQEKIIAWSKIYESNQEIIDSDITGKSIIVVDDLYQSGISMWEYAKFLKRMGAEKVLGLVCVKSLRDSDNL